MEPKIADGDFLHLLLPGCFNDKTRSSTSLQGDCIHIWCPSPCSFHPREGLSECMALIANGACICKSSKTIKKDTVFKWTWEHTPPPQGYTPRLIIEREGKNSHLPVSLWKGFECTFYSCCLWIWLLINLHLVDDYGSPFRDTNRSWHTLDY